MATAFGALLLTAQPAAARPPEPGAAARVRARILDGCVMGSAGTPRASHPVPRCRCYANGVVKAMTPADLQRYLRTGTISDALHDKAERLYAGC
ncbi:MAG TPA: hypothetical protein VHD15_13565 [Hyphomicrobiales bacterium]|nr:hypothetical protein [Hyphomicrobiales bacterium]